MKRYRSPHKQIGMSHKGGIAWGRVGKAFTEIIGHVKETPDASVLLAAGTAQIFVTMHSACEYYLPQAAGWRVAGVWFFPNKARVRIARISDIGDADAISARRFSLMVIHGEAEVVAVLEPLLLPQGRIIPFLGTH